MIRNKAQYTDFSSIKLGQLRCHYDSMTQMWNRVRVMKKMGEKEFEASFIDFGIDKVIKKHDCYMLPDHFKSIPPQYFFASLNKVFICVFFVYGFFLLKIIVLRLSMSLLTI